ncbi:MAG: hypothetical protein DRG30_03110, partial [Epsilonproteobacteria bacterium]
MVNYSTTGGKFILVNFLGLTVDLDIRAEYTTFSNGFIDYSGAITSTLITDTSKTNLELLFSPGAEYVCSASPPYELSTVSLANQVSFEASSSSTSIFGLSLNYITYLNCGMVSDLTAYVTTENVAKVGYTGDIIFTKKLDRLSIFITTTGLFCWHSGRSKLISKVLFNIVSAVWQEPYFLLGTTLGLYTINLESILNLVQPTLLLNSVSSPSLTFDSITKLSVDKNEVAIFYSTGFDYFKIGLAVAPAYITGVNLSGEILDGQVIYIEFGEVKKASIPLVSSSITGAVSINSLVEAQEAIGHQTFITETLAYYNRNLYICDTSGETIFVIDIAGASIEGGDPYFVNYGKAVECGLSGDIFWYLEYMSNYDSVNPVYVEEDPPGTPNPGSANETWVAALHTYRLVEDGIDSTLTFIDSIRIETWDTTITYNWNNITSDVYDYVAFPPKVIGFENGAPVIPLYTRETQERFIASEGYYSSTRGTTGIFYKLTFDSSTGVITENKKLLNNSWWPALRFRSYHYLWNRSFTFKYNGEYVYIGKLKGSYTTHSSSTLEAPSSQFKLLSYDIEAYDKDIPVTPTVTSLRIEYDDYLEFLDIEMVDEKRFCAIARGTDNDYYIMLVRFPDTTRAEEEVFKVIGEPILVERTYLSTAEISG